MKEFELTMRLRNNLIKKRRLALGLSAPQAAERAGVQYATWSRYEALSLSPLGKRTRWKKSATKVSEFFGCTEEDLWPDAVLAVKQPEVVAEIAAEQALALAALAATPHELPPLPSQMHEDAELRALCTACLDLLPPRERLAVETFIAEHSTESAAERLDISYERVRQIQQRAFRRLRESPLATELKVFA